MADKVLKLGTVCVAFEEGFSPVVDFESVKATVQAARQKLAQVVSWGVQSAKSGNFAQCMETFFFVSAEREPVIYAGAVRDVMQRLNDLNIEVQSEELTLKAVKVTPQTQDATAYVLREVPDALWDATLGANPLKPAKFYGPLHMRFDSQAPVATRGANLIHEATHRYLGTRDWAYAVNFDMLEYESTYRAMNLPPPRPPKSVNSLKAWYDMTHAEAMNNADSYAGFVYCLNCG